MTGARNAPGFIWALLVMDLLLCLLHSFFFVLQPDLGPAIIEDILNLNREGNLPTWYSSMQLFLLAELWGILSWRLLAQGEVRKAVAPLLMAVLFILLSLDEIAQIHERASAYLDKFLEGGSRQNTDFSTSGIWMILSIPFVATIAAVLWQLKPLFRGEGSICSEDF